MTILAQAPLNLRSISTQSPLNLHSISALMGGSHEVGHFGSNSVDPMNLWDVRSLTTLLMGLMYCNFTNFRCTLFSVLSVRLFHT